jgi:hypothetical protein
MSDILLKKQRVGIFPQGTFGTPISANEDFETLLWNAAGITVDAGTTINNFELTSATGLTRQRARTVTDRLSGIKRLGFSAPADRYNLALYLVSALQTVTEVATTPYQKVITRFAETAVPDYTSSNVSTGRYLYTLAMDSISGTDGVRLGTAIIDSLSLNIDYLANGVPRYMQLEGQWAGTALSENQDFSSGSWSNNSGVNYYNSSAKMQVNIAGIVSITDVCVRRARLNINNNVTSDCVTTGGAPNNFKISPSDTIELEIPYNATTYDIFQEYLNGTEAVITMFQGTTGNAGFLEIVGRGRLSENPLAENGDYRSINIVCQLEYDGTNPSLKVTLADAVDRNYPAPA